MPWTYWEAVKQNTCFQFTPSVFRGFCWNYVTIPLVTSTCIFLHMKPFSPNFSLVCVGISLTVCERWHHHLTQISLPYHHPKDPWTHLLHHSTHSTPHSLAEHLTLQQLLIPEGLQCQVSQLPMIKVSLFPCFISYSFVLALLYGSCGNQIYVRGNRLDSYRKLDVFSPSMCCLL